MLLSDYETTIGSQIENIHKSRRKIIFYSKRSFGQFLLRYIQRIVEKNIVKINNNLTVQLYSTKGILADLQSKRNELQRKDFNIFIRQIDEIIMLYVTFTHEIEVIIGADKRGRFPQIRLTNSLLKEIIDVQYNILRIIKRYNKNSSQATSDLAIEASKRSEISLETTIYGRKTT